MSPAQKLRMVADRYNAGIQLKAVGLRLKHPDWPEHRLVFEARCSLLFAGIQEIERLPNQRVPDALKSKFLKVFCIGGGKLGYAVVAQGQAQTCVDDARKPSLRC